jgi:hypothetical protein
LKETFDTNARKAIKNGSYQEKNNFLNTRKKRMLDYI